MDGIGIGNILRSILVLYYCQYKIRANCGLHRNWLYTADTIECRGAAHNKEVEGTCGHYRL